MLAILAEAQMRSQRKITSGIWGDATDIRHKRVDEQTSSYGSRNLRNLRRHNGNGDVKMKSDKQVQQDVLAELGWEPSVNAAHIGVEVSDGVVTLAGHVASYAEKLSAERAAQRVAGVKALAVEMDVTLAGDSRRTDGDIARSAENVLQWTTYLPPETIRVKVENGWITLSGQVEWEFQRKTAVDAVRHLMGVTGVSEQIAIKPKVSSTIVKSDIEAAMKRRAQSHAEGITVQVEGADVTLTGVVNSWSERQLAMDTAWGAPGVHNVKDRMSVTF